VVGFDLSMPLLLTAKQRVPSPAWLVRGDMRALPFPDHAFDVVVNLFTSFGYFSDDSQHQIALAAAASALRPGGTLILDYFHARTVRDGLVPRENRVVGAQSVVIERAISSDGRFVTREMHLTGDGRRFSERVRLFAPSELEGMITSAGLRVRDRFGAYDRRPLGQGTPRAIFVAERDRC
jgi:SAM-dependent methyltransferase